MKHAVLGCGLMGSAAVFDLTKNKNITEIIAADVDITRPETLKKHLGDDRIKPVQLDVSDPKDTRKKLDGVDAILAAIHYRFNTDLTKIAIEIGSHFCDLGGNNSIVDEQLKLSDHAKRADISIIPDCGLAPGMVSVVVAHSEKRFDSLESIKIRVGGLPQNPKPPMNYKLVFSVEGLINEYIEPVRVIRDGRLQTIEPLDEIESLSFPPPFADLEAFTTSGGTSTLVNTYLGRVKELNYKTIRYRGHCEKMHALYKMGFFSSDKLDVDGVEISPRAVSGRVFEKSLTNDDKDSVLVLVEMTGLAGKQRKRLTQRLIDLHDDKTGLSAMARTTAFPAIIVSQMQADGRIKVRGTVPQELAVPTDDFFAELRKRNIVFEETFENV